MKQMTIIPKKIKETWHKSRALRIFAYAVFFRVFIYIVSLCVMAMFGEYQDAINLTDFLEAWKRWDGYAYLRIAEDGYAGYQENGQFLDIVFYPLYPWLIRGVTLLTGNYMLSGIIVSVICYGAGCIYFDKLICMECDEETAENALILVSVFPFAFFFGAIMTESLFFALSAAFLYYVRKHKWHLVALVGFLACLTKIQGMLLTLVVIAELFYCYHPVVLLKEKKWKEFWQKIIMQGLKCVPMICGVFVYLLMNYVVEGDMFRFMYYQENHWNHTLGPIWYTLSYMWDYVRESWYTSTGMSLWIPQFVLFFVGIGAILYGIAKKMRPTYLVYLIAFYLLTYSSTWLISGGRYMLNALPMFMLGGRFVAEHPKAKMPLVMASFAFMMVYMIGYYQWKQIM